jgi:aryl-alcohol dehydrogenase-like predicted oxidoreductase
MAQLNRHVDEGKIGAIGASNWSHERISSANTVAASNGLQSFPASSV